MSYFSKKLSIYLALVVFSGFDVTAMEPIQSADSSAGLHSEISDLKQSLALEKEKVVKLEAQLQASLDWRAADDDVFAEVWKQLAEVALTVAALTKNAETPLDTFLCAGLLQFAARRDILYQERLFNALPDEVKYYALYAENPELMAEFVIPNPREVDWSVDR
ncbi:MAG: hypothetical protein LBU02_01255 [Rickettsiales bacterium]|jgi:hypothetical protein|nr:hypothetical protein [Rickettsiales bacterium]